MPTKPMTEGLLAHDIGKILHAPKRPTNHITHKCTIHTVDFDIDITNLISIETSCDYHSDVGDYILVTFTLTMGTAVKVIHPEMDNLEITINTDVYGKTSHSRYRAVIISGLTNVSGNIYSTMSMEELNKMDYVTIEAQCINKSLMEMRNMYVDGVYSYHTVSEVIKALFHKHGDSALAESGKWGLSMYPPNNEKRYRHIVVPAGTSLLDLTTYLQNKDYGVYSAGIGTYITRYSESGNKADMADHIFVYPLYNSKIYEKPGRKLMIYSTPMTNLKFSENSYIVDGDSVKIVGHGDMEGKEISKYHVMDKGNGLILGNAASVMVDGVKVTDGMVSTDLKTNLKGERVKPLAGVNDRPAYMSHTTNPYPGYSDIASNMLSHYNVDWNFSDPDLLYPGMPVTYIYDDHNHGIVRLHGVLHSSFTKYSGPAKIHHSNLNILLEPYIDNITAKTDVVDVRR